MGHFHSHGGHTHEHDFAGEHTHEGLPDAFNVTIPDSELDPSGLNRRGMLRRAGLLGAGLAAGNVLAGAGAASATPLGEANDYNLAARRGGYIWLAGDHHIHTTYSNDAKYRVIDHVRHANAYGLDWMVITDHGNANHSKIGVEKVNPDIKAARAATKDTLVFQGLEWNIPAAEHGTVFVHPGANEVAVLKEFETNYDGGVKKATDSTPANEALAVAGVNFLADAKQKRRVEDVLFLANHPSRKGLDSPHEIRNWRDANPDIAVGFEGAPGHQAGGIKAPQGPGIARGLYDNSATANSFADYPVESYRTWGGFDWLTATVGGVWDSLLAEGKPWWITANSDSHNIYTDTAIRPADANYDLNGHNGAPVHGGSLDLSNGDFWPGYYSRTHVGARDFSYGAVMDGIRNGRVWVDHGGLISGLDVQARAKSWFPKAVTLGGSLTVHKGAQVELSITIDLANGPNWAQFVPELARVDVIQGDVTGPVTNKDTMYAPNTKVVKSFDVNKSTGQVTLAYNLGPVTKPIYVRLRGTDGNRSAVGFRGAAVDPQGPAIDVLGDADPWNDLWFYSNPIWVLPA